MGTPNCSWGEAEMVTRKPERQQEHPVLVPDKFLPCHPLSAKAHMALLCEAGQAEQTCISLRASLCVL